MSLSLSLSLSLKWAVHGDEGWLGSCSLTEVKARRTRLVFGWVTAREESAVNQYPFVGVDLKLWLIDVGIASLDYKQYIKKTSYYYYNLVDWCRNMLKAMIIMIVIMTMTYWLILVITLHVIRLFVYEIWNLLTDGKRNVSCTLWRTGRLISQSSVL